MKKNFINGIILGGLCTVILVLITLGIYTGAVRSNAELNKNKAKSGEKEQSEKEYYDNILEKLSVLELIVDNYFLDDVDNSAFADGIYKGFIASLKDPYSTYYTAQEYAALIESSSGVYSGIGATVSQNVNTGIITIVKPFVTGSAYEVGLLPGDIIYTVEGEEVTGVDLSEVVAIMKGPEGTKVVVEVIREGASEPIKYEITRRKIEVPTIEYELLEDDIGYILITEFDEITISQFKNAVDDLEKQGIKGLVIDLRNNPGGLLESVVEMLDRIISKGLIVYTEDKDGKREEESAKDNDEFTLPLAVIINGNSASASEIFAGTIQDYGIGTVVGTTSFGKGIVQKVVPLTDGTAVKLTISKYYTPKGRNIHGTGIVPDVEVELLDELRQQVIISHEEDNQLQEAIKVLEKQINK